MTANPIDKVFAEARAAGQCVFMPFIVAGDPSLAATGRLLIELSRRGASLIEIGFPYSDPIADGPTIQAAYTRTLASGIKVADVLATVADAGAQCRCPLVAMVSYSIVYRRGPARFAAEAADAGFSGLIVPDLPADEAAELFEHCNRVGLKLIQLVTPTTPDRRIRQILARCSGFVYYVSVTGITGERQKLADTVTERVQRLRQVTDLPICVGFGVSRPDQVRELAGIADGVIVGSAIVRRVAERADRPLEELVAEVGAYVEEMARAAREGSSGVRRSCSGAKREP